MDKKSSRIVIFLYSTNTSSFSSHTGLTEFNKFNVFNPTDTALGYGELSIVDVSVFLSTIPNYESILKRLFQITKRYHRYLSREEYAGVRKISIFTTRRRKNILLSVALLFFARSEITLGVFFLCKVRIVVGGKRSCFLRLAEFTPSIFHRVRRCVYTTEGDYYHSSSLV